MSFSFHDRQEKLRQAPSTHYDLVIVGGGINGAGVAREAAGRGLKVALVEAKDFSIGTSSRSSKLIHGGIRYLENLEFKLVFEALAERGILFDMAPHLVHPLRFVLPIYKSSRVGYFKMGLGMWLYDILSAFEAPEVHVGLNPKQTVQRIPGIAKTDMVGAYEYSDAYMDDDRLVHETLRSANSLGADIFNFCQVTGANWAGPTLKSLNVKDETTGETFKLKGDQFLGALGPWTDIFGEAIAQKWTARMRPTKGVHLTFSKDRIPISKAVVMTVDERIIFVMPRHEMVIVGTTDTDFNGDPYDVSVTKDDVQYILQALKDYFPEFHLKKEDIIASYAGVRPLVEDGSATEGKTSREHQIFSEGENLTFIAGGKYTTYRKIAVDVLSAVLEKVPFARRMSFGPSRSKEPINPEVTPEGYDRVRMQAPLIAKNHGLPSSIVENLVNRHGEEALKLIQIMKTCNFENFEDQRWYAEAVFAIQETCCYRLEDFYWRRSPMFLSEPDHGLSRLDPVVEAFKDFYNWSDDQAQKSIESLKAEMAQELSWKKEAP